MIGPQNDETASKENYCVYLESFSSIISHPMKSHQTLLLLILSAASFE